MSEGTLNYRVLEQCSLSGTCHLSLVMLHTAYYHAIYGFSISCSCLSLHFIVCFLLCFVFNLSQGVIRIAQLRWTRTRTVATRMPAVATIAARIWARLSWGCSTHSLVLALVLWLEMPELRARLQPRYCHGFTYSILLLSSTKCVLVFFRIILTHVQCTPIF